jgi:hypothetical protein
MHLQPVVNTLRSTLAGHVALTGADPTVEASITMIIEALEPAIQLAALELAQQAAAEIGAQLSDRSVEVLVVDGDPVLRLTDAPTPPSHDPAEELDARITLRLPPSLKRLIEDSATVDGDSVNTWVVDALSRRARRPAARGSRVTESFDL